VVVALLAAIAVGAPAATHSTHARCSSSEIPATVGRRTVCLRWGAPCEKKFTPQYLRHGFHCPRTNLRYVWPSLATLRRPLHIPTLQPGEECPATVSNGTLGQRGNTDATAAAAFGPGPAYVTLEADSGSAVLTLTWPLAGANDPYAGWAGTKALWTVPRFAGPVLIRGRQIDGPGPLGLDIGPAWKNVVLPEITVVGPHASLNPAATFVKAPGCYAYQIDTSRSSYLIVFQARLR
jgi:hypothetical protein